MQLKKRLATILFLTVFSVVIIVSCGKKSSEEHPAGEHPTEEADSTEHPSDSTEHPAEHPADSTQNQ